jgi:NitT/TauT family transport system permease protein
MHNRMRTIAVHGLFLVAVLGAWELAAIQGRLDPLFFGQPSGVVAHLRTHLLTTSTLWRDLGWTLAATMLAFATGSALAIAVGLLFGVWPRLGRFAEPYLTALNAMPRIALAPLFILWFGLGVGSKVAVGFSLVFFIVLASTVAGVRGIDTDHVKLARSFGARPSVVLFRIALPGAVPTIFAGLRLSLIFSMLGVVGSEIIASEHGLGQRIAYLSATFDVNGVLAVLMVMSAVGVALSAAMNTLERRLLAWR